MNTTIEATLQQLIEKETKKPATHSILLGVQSKDNRVNFRGAGGDATADSPYFLASATKMYTGAVLMQLVDENKLDLDAPITAYLPDKLIDGIHVYKGVDYSRQLKGYQLFHQTSGLPDYFDDKRKDGSSVMDTVKNNQDQAYTVQSVVEIARDMDPKFAPDANGGKKSHYSDTNYQLLGAIIEGICEKSQAEVFKTRIIYPLGLSDTYLFDCHNPHQGAQPLPFYNKEHALNIPLTMTSELGAGGMVSSLDDSLAFLRAYFEGTLFNSSHFARMMAQWNAIFFPLQYGYGLIRFQMPRVFTLFRYSPEFIGHSGASGSFAFYAPKEGIYLAGTFNQVDKQSRPYAFMMKAINAVT